MTREMQRRNYSERSVNNYIACMSKLDTCFALIETDSFLPQFEGLPAIDVMQMLSGKDPVCCPECGKGKMIPLIIWPEKKKQPG
jgi:hypothetical protein